MDRATELREAIQAGYRAKESLKQAQVYLNSAGNWGLLDVLGGGLISNLFKHSKLNSAGECMDQARMDLNRFRSELQDLEDIPGLTLHIGEFLTFADFFFDGFVADIMVQSRIAQAKAQVAQAIRRVDDVLRQLEQQR